MNSIRDRQAFNQLLDWLALSQGMNSIRDSIHDLHDESLDLYNETTALINSFCLCPVFLDYDIEGSLNRAVKC
jgi:hypothetical protein